MLILRLFPFTSVESTLDKSFVVCYYKYVKPLPRITRGTFYFVNIILFLSFLRLIYLARSISSFEIWCLEDITITYLPLAFNSSTKGAKSLSPDIRIQVSNLSIFFNASIINSASRLPFHSYEFLLTLIRLTSFAFT